MTIEAEIRLLFNQLDWPAAICSCNDPILKRFALYSCARSVLPYWESRYENDESMEKLINAMLIAAHSPSVENDTRLKAAMPKQKHRNWDLSPPPGFIDEDYNLCPADFAGDSIVHAARAMINDSIDDGDDHSALDTALECLARLLAERDPNDDDGTDYLRLAREHLRKKMLENLQRIAMPLSKFNDRKIDPASS